MLALVFDLGAGFTSSRASSGAVRAGARVGALAGENRDADFLVLDALRAQYGDGADVDNIVIYLSDPSNATGAPPSPCAANCNTYPGSILATLDSANFGTVNQVDTAGNLVLDANGRAIEICDPNAIDANWCPLGRRASPANSLLGVRIETTSEAAVGLGTPEFGIDNQAVFAMYFPPLPAGAVPPGP